MPFKSICSKRPHFQAPNSADSNHVGRPSGPELLQRELVGVDAR